MQQKPELAIQLPRPAVLFVSIIPPKSVKLTTLDNHGNYLWVFPDLKQPLHDILDQWSEIGYTRVRLVKLESRYLDAESECLIGLFEGGWNRFLQPSLTANIPVGAIFYAFRKCIPQVVLKSYRFRTPWGIPTPLWGSPNVILLIRGIHFHPLEIYCLPAAMVTYDMHCYFEEQTLVGLCNVEIKTRQSLLLAKQIVECGLGVMDCTNHQPWGVYRLTTKVFPVPVVLPGRVYVIPEQRQPVWYTKQHV